MSDLWRSACRNSDRPCIKSNPPQSRREMRTREQHRWWCRSKKHFSDIEGFTKSTSVGVTGGRTDVAGPVFIGLEGELGHVAKPLVELILRR